MSTSPPQPTSSSSNYQFQIPTPLPATETVKNHSFITPPTDPLIPLFTEAVQNADVFWNLVLQFHASIGNRIRVPKIGGKTLDLHLLFVEVTSRGGFDKVVSDRRWKEVIAAFNLPSTITSASHVIRKYYVTLLYQFEQAYYFGKRVALPQTSEPAQSTSPELQEGSSVAGVIDGKFDSGYLVSVKIGGEVLKGVLYHVPQETQKSDTSNASALPPETSKSQKLSKDLSSSQKSRKGYSLSFSEDYARVQPLCYGQEEKVTTNNNIASSQSKLAGGEIQAYAYHENGMNGDTGC